MLLWGYLCFPLPVAFLDDPDLAHQLAGAQQLLAGEHPCIDFRSSYGPLVFYASAVGQVISGNRVLGEMILDIAGNLVAYVLLAWILLRAIPRRPLLALTLLGVAVLCLPRIHKYYIVLAPVLTVAATLAYARRPGRLRLALVGAAVAAAGLFRQDMGVLAFVVALAGVLLPAGSGSDSRPRRAAELAGFVVLAAAPYLVFAALRGGLGSYLRDSVVVSLSKSSGLALPFPAFHWAAPVFSTRNGLSWIFAFYFVQPVVGLLVYLRIRAGLSAEARQRWIVVLLMSAGWLVHASHRADYLHLLQAIPMSFVLAGMILDRVLPDARGDRTLSRPLGSVWTAVSAFSLALTIYGVAWPSFSPGEQFEKFGLFARSRERFLEIMHERVPDHWAINASLDLRRCLEPDERFLSLPFFPQPYYLSGHLFAAGQMLTAPGYFDSEAYQEAAIERMERQSVPVVLLFPGFAFDGRKDRTIDVTHPILFRYVTDRFAGRKRYAGFVLAIRRDLDPARRETLEPCLLRN